MSTDKQELTTEESHESADSGELLQAGLEQAAGGVAGIRTEMLNNKYPENMKHEVREHTTIVADSGGELKDE